LLLFLYVTEEAGRKYVRDMPWPPAAECNMITNKQTNSKFTPRKFCHKNHLRGLEVRVECFIEPKPSAVKNELKGESYSNVSIQED